MSAEVTVNGEKKTFEEGLVLSDVLEKLHVEPDRTGTAVAVNDEVVPRARWGTLTVRAGDRIEIVRPVQGG